MGPHLADVEGGANDAGSLPQSGALGHGWVHTWPTWARSHPLNLGSLKQRGPRFVCRVVVRICSIGVRCLPLFLRHTTPAHTHAFHSAQCKVWRLIHGLHSTPAQTNSPHSSFPGYWVGRRAAHAGGGVAACGKRPGNMLCERGAAAATRMGGQSPRAAGTRRCPARGAVTAEAAATHPGGRGGGAGQVTACHTHAVAAAWLDVFVDGASGADVHFGRQDGTCGRGRRPCSAAALVGNCCAAKGSAFGGAAGSTGRPPAR
mmetsp:Transcript_4071/g.11627  ORF Transcript_4071/g.11627 Transcript_4071/m.11627 type:complete len:260 (+) Transcript_4071:582-1361(+)